MAKLYLKNLLRFILCFQLAFSPAYGFSEDTKSQLPIQNNESPILDQLQKSALPPHLHEKIKIIEEMTLAIEGGQESVESFLDKHSELLREDHYLFSGQKAEAIEQHVNEQKQIQDQVVKTVDLNDANDVELKIIPSTVEVLYDEESKKITFEGTKYEKPVIRHIIPNIDVVSFKYDKDLLILLERGKGLLVVDMAFVNIYIGRAPIPVIRLPIKNIESWPKDISIEFISRTTAPPEHIPDTLHIPKNIEGEFLLTAGDILVTSLNEKGEKTTVKWIKKEDALGRLYAEYTVLNAMVMVTAPNLAKDKESWKHFEKILSSIHKQQEQISENSDPKEIFLDSIIYSFSFFHRQAVSKLAQAQVLIGERANRMKSPSARDKMILSEWQNSYNYLQEAVSDSSWIKYLGKKTLDLTELKEEDKNITEDLQKLIEQISQNQSVDSKKIQTVLDAHSEASLLAQEKLTAKSLRWVAGQLTKFKKSVMNNKAIWLSIAIPTVGFAKFPEQALQFLQIFSSIQPTFMEGGVPYIHSAINHFPLLLALLGSIYAASWLSIPVLKNIILPFTPENLPIGQKVYYPKTMLEEFINEWKSKTLIERAFSAVLKVTAVAINPLYNYIPPILGQPYFIPSLQKKLNPFTKVDPDSKTGKAVGLKQPSYIGLSRFHWEKNPEEEHIKELLWNAEERTHLIIQELASTLTVHALSDGDIVPHDILTLRSFSMPQDTVEKIIKDKSLRSTVFWVQKQLAKEIKKANIIDLQEHFNGLTVTAIVRFFERAEILIQKESQQSQVRRDFRVWRQNTENPILKQLRENPNPAEWNQRAREILNMNLQFHVEKKTTREMVIDHIMAVLATMTVGPRASMDDQKGADILAVDINDALVSDYRNLTDDVFNLYLWLAAGSAHNVLTFIDNRSRINNYFPKIDSEYSPIGQYEKPIQKNPSPGVPYMLDVAKQPLDILKSPSRRKKIEKGETNFGNFVNRFYLSRLYIFQMNLLLGFGAFRFLFTDQSLSHIMTAFLLFHFSSLWVYGWVWALIHAGYQDMNDQIEKNKAQLEDLRLKLDRIIKGHYENEDQRYLDYQSAVYNWAVMYRANNPKIFKQLETSSLSAQNYMQELEQFSAIHSKIIKILDQIRANPDLENQIKNMLAGNKSIVSHSLEKLIIETLKNSSQDKILIQILENPEQREVLKKILQPELKNDIVLTHQTVQSMLNLLTSHPPLHNTENKTADRYITVIAGVLTTVLGLILFTATYEDSNLTAQNIGKWILIHFTALTVLYTAFTPKKLIGSASQEGWIEPRGQAGRALRSTKIGAKKLIRQTKNTCRKIFGTSN